MPIKSYIGDLFSTQFIKFLLVGGISAGINFGSRFLFQLVFSYLGSVALGFCAGTVSSFILNRSYTFQAKEEPVWIQMVKYVIAALGAIAAGTVIAWAALQVQALTGIPSVGAKEMESIAHIVSIGLTTLYNFFTIKYFCLRALPWFSWGKR